MPIFATVRIFMRTSCDRPALSSNPLRISARIFYCAFVSVFSFLHYFPAIRPLSRQEKLENTDIVVASLPSDFHRFLLLRAEWIFAPSFTEWEYPRLSERIARFQKARESNVFALSPLRLRYSLLFDFLRPCDLSHCAVRLDSVFASEKCANVCEAREHPPSTQTPAQPSFSRRCCDIAGSVYGPRLSDIRRRVR